ncbi:isoprenylcysteine carboxylmethyltransferase family protein [candidate division KSB1 bacterium]|nr:isoprenylcysteine carboxylmethyltransferase family protein [candidate division KSB1 bacterium]NIV68838.1 DUF1295 domain-containing protein [Phycisphaerae bacterium]NIR68680.1 isoprenylcysteine carboxylmethyltransferase family protein [candidate division KSB1 bacterium]NIS25499.1 isoprenylcysteine carboxylmethyltransferase family protein [candidate division KSB1 bacterium]NIT72388.1 isoprenylcysteine carboxylmethyltransferase family protein [candidate division KSB1 bacterium]
MSEKVKKLFTPAVWLFYLVIGVEIVYMISPFAIYYYSTYGPSLNFLHKLPQTAWLSGFFLPHYVKTSSFLLNHYQIVGWSLVIIGFLFFLVGAGQIYTTKLTKRGAVTGGIYKHIRHPQYVAFAVMGFGLLLAWPRFTVLIIYVTMLFVYFLLAKKEEQECEQKFGESYKSYKAHTSMFIPGRFSFFDKFPGLPKSRVGRFAAVGLLYVLALTVSVSAAFALRNYSLSKITTVSSENSVTISADYMSEPELQKIAQIALTDPDVALRIHQAKNGRAEVYLNYVVPAEWYLPDVPIEKIPEGVHGHHQPKEYDRNKYKVLFTKAKVATKQLIQGRKIIKNAYGREPILLAYVDKAKGEVTAIKTPPRYVKWGDIPTPLF